jgi:hypothetical protein
MKYLAIAILALVWLSAAANAQSGDPRTGAYGGASGFFGAGTGAVNPNRHPGYACAINMKCDGQKNIRPLDPNAPIYRPTWTPQQAKARKRLEAVR